MKQILFLLTLLIGLLSFTQTQIGLDIDGEAENDASGDSVSLSADGTIVAIGATANQGNGFLAGHVRVFENIGGVWTQIGLDIDGEAENDESGYSVSLSPDGSTVAIGATRNDENGDASGHVRIYENINNVWMQIGDDIDGEAAFDGLGNSVSLSLDGSIIAISSPGSSVNGDGSGQVRVYKNINNVWTQVGGDINGEMADDFSGWSVSLSIDGSIVAISAPLNNGNGVRSGHVRVFKNINSVWTQVGTDIDGEAEQDRSGYSLSLSADGSIVAIGANRNDGFGPNSGHVRVYKNIDNVWIQEGGDIEGEADGDRSGESVSLSADGSIVAIGSLRNDGSNGLNSGHVRVYQNINNVWIQAGTDIDGEASGDGSGEHISLSADGSIVAISASSNSGNAAFSGQVRVYDLSAVLSLNTFVATQFSLYPNPAKSQFTIQLENNTILENVNIYNNLGQLVLTSKKLILDISKLASGLYVVEIETNKRKSSKKMIIE